MKKSHFNPAVIDEAIKYVETNGIVDKAGYLDGYEALRNLFEKKLDFTDVIDVQIGAYAVYGWMPTIMKKIKPGTQEQLRSFSNKYRQSKNSKEGLEATRSGEIDLKTINNSVVGTSKFLHFVAPDIFPIWDSRIGAAFSLKYEQQINNEKVYPEYCREIHSYLESSIEWPTAFDEFKPVSDIRKIEFCLFQFGKLKPTHAPEASVS